MPIQVGEPRRETEYLINLSQGDLLQTSVPDVARRLALPVVVKLHVLRDLDPQRPLNTLFVISQAFKRNSAKSKCQHIRSYQNMRFLNRSPKICYSPEVNCRGYTLIGFGGPEIVIHASKNPRLLRFVPET